MLEEPTPLEQASRIIIKTNLGVMHMKVAIESNDGETIKSPFLPTKGYVIYNIVESYSVASLIEAADAAVKSAKVQLVELRLAMALGGKAFFSVTGDVAAVTSAVEAGARIVSEKGLLVNKVIIANPRQELLSEMI